MQMGKKKLALEHVIVQKMDEDGPGEDVQSILTFGARQLFEEGENDRSIICSYTLSFFLQFAQPWGA
jgi:chromodomain-helicase-DNA-binding protein 4